MSDLGLRVASALVLGPAVLALVWAGGIGFVALACLAAVLVVWEWSGIVQTRSDLFSRALLGAGVAAFILLAWSGWWTTAIIVLLTALFATQFAAGQSDPLRLLWLGGLYAALPALALVMLRQDAEFGRLAVFWLMLVVWSVDIGGYFAGRLIGGPKLWPAVSPKKTWSGALGGTLAAVAVGWFVLHLVLETNTSTAAVLLLTAFIAAVAQLGDLAESALKRRFGVKDSGRIIPGHGGLMDRIDGLLAAALVAAVIGALRSGTEAAGRGLLLW